MSAYDKIARLYDPWSRTVVEDVPFYVDEAKRVGGPVLELGVGTGRIAVPVAAAGFAVVGIDTSAGMLEVARETAALAGVERRPAPRRHARSAGRGRVPARDRAVPLAAAHGDRRRPARGAARGARASRAGRAASSSTSSRPSAEDIEETHGRWLEREPGIWERADWQEASRTLILRVRGEAGAAEMSLAWLAVREWKALLREEGFVVEQLYGWFDRKPWRGGEDSICVCRKRKGV